jgi:hypothetical protein
MSKSNATEVDVLKANLKGVDPSWRANANRYLAWHTADPGEAGSAITNEATYGGYTRTPIPIADWDEVGSIFDNTNLLQAPVCASGSQTLTHVSIVTTAAGAGQIIYSGALITPIPVAPPIQPQFSPGALTVTED